MQFQFPGLACLSLARLGKMKVLLTRLFAPVLFPLSKHLVLFPEKFYLVRKLATFLWNRNTDFDCDTIENFTYL